MEIGNKTKDEQKMLLLLNQINELTMKVLCLQEEIKFLNASESEYFQHKKNIVECETKIKELLGECDSLSINREQDQYGM